MDGWDCDNDACVLWDQSSGDADSEHIKISKGQRNLPQQSVVKDNVHKFKLTLKEQVSVLQFHQKVKALASFTFHITR